MRALMLAVCLAAIAAPAAAQWVRPEGGQRSTIRRGERPAENPPPMLGGLDLNAYCRQRGFNGARLEGPLWVCFGEEGRTAIDMTDACRSAFGPDVGARQVSDSPMSWVCFGEVDRSGEGAPTAEPATPTEGVAPGAAPTAAPTPSPTLPGAPPILGQPPAATPPPPPAAAPAEPEPTGLEGLIARVLSPWTDLPFYARAIIAGLGSLVLGLLVGTMLRRKPGKEG